MNLLDDKPWSQAKTKLSTLSVFPLSTLSSCQCYSFQCHDKCQRLLFRNELIIGQRNQKKKKLQTADGDWWRFHQGCCKWTWYVEKGYELLVSPFQLILFGQFGSNIDFKMAIFEIAQIRCSQSKIAKMSRKVID